MLVVGVEKEFRNSKGDLCVLDRRNWVFRPALDPANPPSVSPLPSARPSESSGEEGRKTAPDGFHVKEYNRDEALLFRFSALTFNAHRIHYDKTWAREVEGHRGLVVHGPMNLIAMLDLWRDEVARVSDQEVVYPAGIDYRAVSPVYANEPYRVLAKKEATIQEVTEVKVVSNDGTLCMKGTIKGWA
jgi:hydroxyacyl-ACP dehydratase HTD2-like protein with hotdog domain